MAILNINYKSALYNAPAGRKVKEIHDQWGCVRKRMYADVVARYQLWYVACALILKEPGLTRAEYIKRSNGALGKAHSTKYPDGRITKFYTLKDEWTTWIHHGIIEKRKQGKSYAYFITAKGKEKFDAASKKLSADLARLKGARKIHQAKYASLNAKWVVCTMHSRIDDYAEAKQLASIVYSILKSIYQQDVAEPAPVKEAKPNDPCVYDTWMRLTENSCFIIIKND